MSTHYKAEISEGKKFDVTVEENGSLTLNGKEVSWDVADVRRGQWHVLHENRSFNVSLVSLDAKSKHIRLLVNDELFEVTLRNDLDELLNQLGMESDGNLRMVDVRAPMPGLVLKIMVEAGSQVSAGDPLVILEAMKMENVIKATGDGMVKHVLVSNQDAVEKNQVLIEME